MKRSLQSEPSLPLKRRNSSLFSISTVVEEEEEADTQEQVITSQQISSLSSYSSANALVNSSSTTTRTTSTNHHNNNNKNDNNDNNDNAISNNNVMISTSTTGHDDDDDNDNNGFFIEDSSASSSSPSASTSVCGPMQSSSTVVHTTKPVVIEISSVITTAISSSDNDTTTCSISELERLSLQQQQKQQLQQQKIEGQQSNDSSSAECFISRQNTATTPITTTTTTTTSSSSLPSNFSKKTGIVHEEGIQHFDRHNKLHKERSVRVTSILQALQSSKLLDQCCTCWSSSSNSSVGCCCCTTTNNTSEIVINTSNDDKDKEKDNDKAAITAGIDFLNDEDYLRVHLPGYMQRLDKLGTLTNKSSCSCPSIDEQLDYEAQQYKSIYFTTHSVKEAKRAASSLCALVSKVVQDDGPLQNGFAIIRPPGHHAEPAVAGGYCIINNVAVAAAYARAKLGMKRILIVDWDVHHGNGTQQIFLNDPNVLYFSVHRWQGGNFFPFLQNGGPTTVGVGKGVGYNINVGWSRKGMGDNEYYAVWEHILLPVAKEYQPDLILISAGFDAAEGDLGECHVTPECFGELTRALLEANINSAQKKGRGSRIVATLEGGYVRSILGQCVVNVVQSLLNYNQKKKKNYNDEKNGDDDDDDQSQTNINIAFPLDSIDSFAAKNIQSTIAAHKSYWKCFGGEGR